MNPRLVVSLIVIVGVMFSSVMAVFPVKQTVVCYIAAKDGTIVDTFMTDAGSYGCQTGIGYCTKETCSEYAKYVRNRMGIK